MNNLTKNNESFMTVREVSEALSCSDDTIRYAIKKLMPNKMKLRTTTYLNETEVTAIKLELDKSKCYRNDTVGKTQLEKKLIIKQAKEYEKELGIIQNNYVTKNELKDFGVSIVKEMFKQMMPLIENKRKEYTQDYFSVIGYANNKNISISFSEAVRFGKDASKLSIEMKKEKRIIPDERFGKVGSYHVSVLEKIFEV